MHTVVFTGGEATLAEDSKTFFDSFPIPYFVIAADSGLDTLEKYNDYYRGKIDFSPDFVLGDMDSISNKNLLLKYKDKVQVFPADKDYTDTELALEKAYSLNSSIITLIGGAGGFSDHFLGIYDTFSTCFHPDFWLCGNQILCLVEKDEVLFIYNLNQSDRISVARTTDNYIGGQIQAEGLEWGNSVFRHKGMPSISNRISKEYFLSGKPVTLTVKEGKYIVIFPASAIPRKEMLCSSK